MSEINSNIAERFDYLKKNPSAFMEEICGIKLNRFQKTMIDQINKIKPTPRNPMKKWNNYINLCIAFCNMKDDDYIVIATPKKWDKLNKEQFAEYIENYWK